MARAHVLVLALLLPLTLGGCIAEIIAPAQDTTRSFACGAINPTRFDRMDLVLLEEQGMALDLMPSLGLLADRLAQHTARELDTLYMLRDDAPEGPWTLDDLRAEFEAMDFTTRGRIVFRAVILEQIEGLDDVAVLLRPGTIAVSAANLRAAAMALDTPREQLAEWVVLHFAGHALGVVNDGIPMRENHEGLPKHEADRDSVMHPSWHDPSSRAHVPAGRPNYSASVVADWQGAIQEVCA